jgi:hypothetical protein
MNSQKYNKQLTEAQEAWNQNVGLPAVRKLSLYRRLSSAFGGSFTATGADDKFVYVTERIHELFTGAWDDTFVEHKVPVRYLEMTDTQILAERRADECLLAGIDRVEDAKRYHAIKDKYKPEYDYDDWSDQDLWF